MARNAREIFAAIDSMELGKFSSYLKEDAEFRFGNADPIVGREGIDAGIEGFWGTISGMRHHIKGLWDVDADTTVAFIDVEYTRQDGEHVFTPNVDIIKWEGDEVASWQIVIDIAPIYAPIDEVPAAARSLQTV